MKRREALICVIDALHAEIEALKTNDVAALENHERALQARLAESSPPAVTAWGPHIGPPPFTPPNAPDFDTTCTPSQGPPRMTERGTPGATSPVVSKERAPRPRHPMPVAPAARRSDRSTASPTPPRTATR